MSVPREPSLEPEDASALRAARRAERRAALASLRSAARAIGVGGLLLFAFQNCMGPGFAQKAVLSDNAVSAPRAVDPPTGGSGATPTPPPALRALIESELSGTELVPIALRLQTSAALTPAAMPPGASFDAATKTLYWMPLRGQAGRRDLVFDFDVGGKGYRALIHASIASIPDGVLLSGPPDFYRPGEVGYVFVHGAGSVDRCANRADLQAYWLNTPELLEPNAGLRTLACYNSSRAVEEVAPQVAQQILDANCGSMRKCVVVTHSMGGLVMEFMLSHLREARFGEPEPELFAQRELFQRVRDRLAMIVSLGSAAGGSKVASIVFDPGGHELVQEIGGDVANLLGAADGATYSVTTQRATNVLAPLSADSGVPFFMVAGYSTKTAREESGSFGGFFDVLTGSFGDNVFNGDRKLASLDYVVQFNSRSDGLVDFRSACGIQSGSDTWGAGSNAALSIHLSQCFFSQRKPSHYPWFAINMNHFIMTAPSWKCQSATNPCVSTFPNPSDGTYSQDGATRGLSAIETMRARLHANRYGLLASTLTLDLDSAIPK